jgi:hypothetical protein
MYCSNVGGKVALLQGEWQYLVCIQPCLEQLLQQLHQAMAFLKVALLQGEWQMAAHNLKNRYLQHYLKCVRNIGQSELNITSYSCYFRLIADKIMVGVYVPGRLNAY